jgi:hypothetical protein
VSDPLLDAHRENDLHYVISGPQPISLRDQMLRGIAIVDRLYAVGEIGPNRPLVIRGAGAAGATAAMAASKLMVETTLVETAAEPFQTQFNSNSRWIDPTQYDWPLDHFGEGRLPWDTIYHREMPLTFRAGPAKHLASVWRRELAMSNPMLRMRFKHRVRTVVPYGVSGPPTEMLLVTLDDSGEQIRAGALIDAKGFGREQCAFRPPGAPKGTPSVYEGIAFWGQDRFEQLTNNRHRVLISGSGDGALQDYLRVVTQLPAAGDIVARCDIPSAILRAIQSAEDRAVRGWAWVADEPRALRLTQETPYFTELEHIHRQRVAEVLAIRGISTRLDRVVPQNVVPVHLVYRQPYMTAFYGLNRFLVLLLSEYVRLYRRMATVYPEVEISEISAYPPHSHVCINASGRADGDYDATGTLTRHTCFGMAHDVTLTAAAAGAIVPPKATYNVVIIRHGLERAPKLKLKRRRHLPPFHLAGQ